MIIVRLKLDCGLSCDASGSAHDTGCNRRWAETAGATLAVAKRQRSSLRQMSDHLGTLPAKSMHGGVPIPLI